MIDYTLSSLKIDSINRDNTQFDWFADLKQTAAQTSDSKLFFLPIVVQKINDDSFLLVDGFRRLEHYLNCEQKTLEIPCVVLPENLDIQLVCKIRLSALSARQLDASGFCVMQIMSFLALQKMNRKEIAEMLMPQFRMKASEHYVRMILDLKQKINDFTQNDVLHQFSFMDLLPLSKLNQDDIYALLQLASVLNVTGKKWKNIIQNLHEVSRLNEISISKLLEWQELSHIVQNEKLDNNIRYKLMSEQLIEFRYPELSSMQSKFQRYKNDLKLGNKVDLSRHEYFENEDLSLKITFNSKNDLHQQMEMLNQIKEKDQQWDAIFGLYEDQ